MTRRLPVYLLIDTSGSMFGEPIEAVRNGIQLLQSSLAADPYALETAWISIITFDTVAKQITPLTEMPSFVPPTIEATGCTALGGALKLLVECVKKEVRRSTPDVKGDWRPLVFIMTDGVPTDDYQTGIEAVKQLHLGTIVGCCVGPHADDKVLKMITEDVVSLETADTSTLRQFFKWISTTVSTKSASAPKTGDKKEGISDLPPPPDVISII